MSELTHDSRDKMWSATASGGESITPASVPEDAIAIVGMALRFPGEVNDERDFWRALLAGADLVTQVPDERWAVEELRHPRRAEPGRSITFAAGVLSQGEGFDAAFFGISPREAGPLDPQQRLMLELAWEALENGGQRASALAGSDTAVYVGLSSLDNGMRGLDDLANMSGHAMTGNTLSIVANRISYFLDLRGPSMALDTACSSSLVAVHQACQALRQGEAQAAFAGGVNLLLHPYSFVGFTKASMLAAGERCRAFDAAGDGYVRAEGGAMLLLKRARDAIAAGDPIQALILASGINTDGARKTGLTIPSGEAQIELMQRVLARSGLAPQDIAFVEAHGTGTPVGDPIEAAAIGTVYGQARTPQDPLPIGSVKTNLGHLEPVSGLAGLGKAVLALQHRMLPGSLHQREANPYIDFATLNIQVPSENLELRAPCGQALVAGVNSFGFGGANAHVLLQEFRAPGMVAGTALPARPLVLSARSEAALRALAARYAELLHGADEDDLAALACAAHYQRERLERRLLVRGDEPAQVAEQLRRFAQGEVADAVLREDAMPRASAARHGVAFVYAGNGAQWLGMGRRLLAESARFRAEWQRLDAMLAPLAGYSILTELQAEAAQSRLDQTEVAQPLLFALQVAITQLLREAGLRPDAVLGHSVGEVAAAWAAGALTLEQAAQLICVRSAAQAVTRGAARMAVLGLPETEARALLQRLADAEAEVDLEIAGINSPRNVTLSGRLADLQRVGAEVESRGVFFRLLDLDYGFHSRHMDPIRAPLAQRLQGLAARDASTARFVSSVTGGELSGPELDAAYWWRNVRQPVRFAEAIGVLAAQGCRVFVEVGPQAVLQRYLSETLSEADVNARVLPTLRRDDDGLPRIIEAALRVQLLADTDPHERVPPMRAVRLPNYPWQRERHLSALTSEAHGLIHRRRVHPLLGWRLSEVEVGWENTIDPLTVPWLAEHRVGGAVVFPGAAFVEVALAAARAWRAGESVALEHIDILAPLVFEPDRSRLLRVNLDPRDGGIRIQSRPRFSSDPFTVHAVARCLEPGLRSASTLAAVSDAATTISREHHYRLADSLALDFGPRFRGLRRARVDQRLLEVEVDAPEQLGLDAGYLLHPAVLDLCYQSFIDFFHARIEGGGGSAYLPVKIGRVELWCVAPVSLIRACLRRDSPRSLLADFELIGANGELIARLAGCRLRSAPLLRREQGEPAQWQTRRQLRPHPRHAPVAPVPSPEALAQTLSSWFERHEAELQRRVWFAQHLPLLEALTLAAAREAIEAMTDGAAALPADWGERGPPLRRWLLQRLAQEDVIALGDDGWRLCESVALPSCAALWCQLWREAAHCAPWLALLARAAKQLPALLDGRLPGAELHRALAKSPLSDARHCEDPAYHGTHLALVQTLGQLATAWPASQRLRVLEVGEGDELLRAALQLPVRARLDYVLACANADLRERLQAAYRGATNIVVLDEDAWCEDAALSPSRDFDLILLHHRLHRARDPQQWLRAAHARLAPGGLLIVAERHADWNLELIEGCDPQWWQQGSDSLPRSRLQAPAAWRELLQAQGFDPVSSFIEPAAQGLSEGAYLLLARRPAPCQPVPAAEPEPASWCLLADADSIDVAQALREQLQAQGQHVQVVLPDAQPVPPATAHLAFLRGWGATADAAAGVCADFLTQLRVAVAREPTPHLWVIARGGALCDALPPRGLANPVQAALWGLVRVAMNEHPALCCRLIDVAAADAADLAQRLSDELLYADGADEIVLDADSRHQLITEPVGGPSSRPDAATAARYRLDFAAAGQLRNLQWTPQGEVTPGAHEIEVRPLAAGLNFRDVMYLMGLLPDEAVEGGFAGATLGLEFAGVVERVGAEVRDLVPGDAVLGFGAACFASHVTTRRDAVTTMPPGWSFEAAATVPTAFFTAWYALTQLANLQPGERVLIHGAAGGVGLAAIQIARHLGAEIYATAGSEEKRELVRLLGAQRVFDSRRLDFAEELLTATAQQGVDVVLNSLAGEAVRRSLQVLRPFGRFLELGKRDFYENTAIGLRPFKDNIAYFGIDADRLLTERPALAARLFEQLMGLLREGVLTPLPHRVFEAGRVVEAFRQMQQSRHIGKIVVSLRQAPDSIEAEAVVPAQVRGIDGCWLVSGGLAGFGLASAQWLAAQGARHLVLLGRRGIDTPGAAAAVAQLRARGVTVWVEACDVGDRAALDALLQRVRAQLPPLRGVLHAAMQIDDGLLADLDEARLQRVLRPKLLGAMHLHDLTRDAALSHFVLYSSITTLLGSPGQGNYVAANAALEALAQLRRAQGLPVTCLGWGPIADVGFLARNESLREGTRRRMGAAALESSQALAALGASLGVDQAPRCVADFDWSVLSRLLPAATSPRFDTLRASASDASADEEGDFRSRIRGKSPDQVLDLVRELVRQDVARILCLAVDRIEPHRSLHEAGMDSLMAVELAYGLEQRFGFQLPVMSLNEGPSVERIARRIADALLGGDAAAPPAAASLQSVVRELARQHGERATAEEIAALAERAQDMGANEARADA